MQPLFLFDYWYLILNWVKIVSDGRLKRVGQLSSKRIFRVGVMMKTINAWRAAATSTDRKRRPWSVTVELRSAENKRKRGDPFLIFFPPNRGGPFLFWISSRQIEESISILNFFPPNSRSRFLFWISSRQIELPSAGHLRLFFQEPNIIVLAGRKKDDGQTIFSQLWSKISFSTKLVSFFSSVQRSTPTTEESIHILFNEIAQWHEIEMGS